MSDGCCFAVSVWARGCASVDSTHKKIQNFFLARLGWFSAAGATYLIWVLYLEARYNNRSWPIGLGAWRLACGV